MITCLKGPFRIPIKMNYRRFLPLALVFHGFVTSLCGADELSSYVEQNRGVVSFDVSMPIDATGFTLKGKNLKGGKIEFRSRGTYLSHRLAHETGEFHLPVVMSSDGRPLIATKIEYEAIKLVAPIGLDNFFIKIGTANRSQTVAGLDPTILKDGTYTWRVPIFAAGKESDTVDGTSRNEQFMQVGMTGGPASGNVEYTQEFYLCTQGDGTTPISRDRESMAKAGETLAKARVDLFSAEVHGLWGSGGADPYRTISGQCTGSSTTFPAGPNLDYEYGTYRLPTVHTPWDATPEDHGIINGKRHAGCVNASIDSEVSYMAQKLRVPVSESVSVFAESGSMYRKVIPDNLRYVCSNNVYLKNLLPEDECLKKSYLPGGYAAPFFAVGYEVNRGSRLFSARYLYIPGAENSNRLAWRDASDTQIYAVSASGVESGSPTAKEVKDALNEGLEEIRGMPAVYDLLGARFLEEILEKNGMSEP